jgi:hypothetical protein
MTTAELDSSDSTSAVIPGETSRFLSILHRHTTEKGSERHRLRDVLVEYLCFSPESNALINSLIGECIEMPSPDRLEIAIDVLAKMNEVIYEYAKEFRLNDIRKWKHLYPGKEYRPNADYWFILLRAVAQSEIDESKKLYFIGMCLDAPHRGVLEGVAEALGDIDSDQSRTRLSLLIDNDDPFIAELANELLDQG